MEKFQYLSDDKTYKSMAYGLSLAFFAHLIFLIIFFENHIEPLFYLNILSVFSYLFLLWLLAKKQVIYAMVGASIELILHQIMAVHYLGWGYGFEYFLLVVPSFVLLGAFQNKLVPLLFTFISIAALFLLKLYSLDLQAEYSLASIKQNLILMNLLFTALPIAFFTGFFAFNSYKNEARLLKAHLELYDAATFDPLTGLHNRAQGLQKLNHLYSDSLQLSKTYVLALLDIDNFKAINDDFGHLVGDKVLETVAKQLKDSLRKQDCVFRWGGEEFLVLFPDTDAARGQELLEQIMFSISHTAIKLEEKTIFITMTAGMVESNARKNEQLIKLADQALYKGKETGKNCIVPALY